MSYYNEKGLKRFVNAIFFSLAGLNAAWTNEEAFRQEVIIFFVAIPLVFWLGNNNIEKILLLGSVILVLVIELLNSAIEAVVDRAGIEYHELAGRAKDMGSAAVVLSMSITVITWFLILI